MSQIFYGSHHGYYSPEPPSSGFEQKPGSSSDSRGFRLVHASSELVGRGGGWYYDPHYARVAPRNDFVPGLRYGDLGFRLVKEST